jgi:hypothetical protein
MPPLDRRGLLLVPALAIAMASPEAESMGSVGTRAAAAGLDFAVAIPRTAVLRTLHQALWIEIGEADIARGFVDAPLASRLEIRANVPYWISFEPHAAWFASVEVSGFRKPVTVDSRGGRDVEGDAAPGIRTYELSYRFALARGTTPGRYAWPVSLAMTAA